MPAKTKTKSKAAHVKAKAKKMTKMAKVHNHGGAVCMDPNCK